MSKPRHLSLVRYNPEDFSLGEVLVRDSQQELKDANSINAAMSLLFQWSEEASALVILDDSKPIPALLDYDREDRAPSEIWVRCKKIAEFSGIPLSVSFSTTLEFSSKAL